MRQSSLTKHEPFLAAAILAAFGVTSFTGFRQSNVKFMLELFTNWVESGEEFSTLQVQNTQVSRYIHSLVEDGYARQRKRNEKQPHYQLTPAGVLELLHRVIERDHFNPREHFFFVYFFIHGYRTRLIGFIKNSGIRYPYGPGWYYPPANGKVPILC